MLLLCCVLVVEVLACGDDDAVGPDATALDGSAPSDAGETGWRSLPDVGLGAIQEIGVAELDGVVYVVAGFNDQLQIVPSVQIFDIASNDWSTVADLPQAVHHANVAVVGGRVYVVGAMQLENFNFVAIGNVWEYDPGANEWTEKAPMPAGTERGASAVGVIDGVIYIAGGLRGGSVAELSSYDPSTNTWDTTLPSLPSPRDHLVGAVVDGTFYAIGGRSGGITSLMGDVEAYTPGGGWVAQEPMPTPRGGAAAGVVDGKIVVAGGEGNSAAPSGVFPDVESYNPSTGTWSTLDEMKTPRHGMGAAGHDGILYVPGGATVQAFGAVSTFEALVP